MSLFSRAQQLLKRATPRKVPGLYMQVPQSSHSPNTLQLTAPGLLSTAGITHSNSHTFPQRHAQMSDQQQQFNSPPPAPRRLSWGRSNSSVRQQQTSRPATSSSSPGSTQLHTRHELSKHDSGIESQQIRDQQPAADSSVGQQACRAMLREVLAAVLGESGAQQLDHYQLTLPVSQKKTSQAWPSAITSPLLQELHCPRHHPAGCHCCDQAQADRGIHSSSQGQGGGCDQAGAVSCTEGGRGQGSHAAAGGH